MWPILLLCNFLPPRLRFKDENIIVAGLFHAESKPNIHEFFKPLAEELSDLSKNGIFVRDRIFKLFITNASFDLPAKSLLSQVKQYNSWEACNFCFQKGERTIKGIRYTYEESIELRTHSEIIQDISKVNRYPNKSFRGIKGISPMIAFKNFDLANSFCVDYMHCVLLGVVKNLLNFWTDTRYKREPFYISKKKRDILNTRLLQIKIPTYISRRPRSLHNLKLFKSSEYRNLLLYYLPVCLKSVLPKKYISHLRALSSAIYQLLEPSISPNDLEIVEKKLNNFVQEYQIYYGKINMTMNVHSLLHLVDCVKNFGPLYCYSMFSFESYNGVLKNFVSAPTDVLHQITTKYVASKTLDFRKVSMNADKNTLKNEIDVKFEKDHFDAFEKADLKGNIECYACFVRNTSKFASKLYKKAVKTADFYVYTTSGLIGAVHFYCTSGYESYAMVEIFEIYKTVNQIKKVRPTNECRIIRTGDIIDRCIYIQVCQKDYIVMRPNSYERN